MFYYIQLKKKEKRCKQTENEELRQYVTQFLLQKSRNVIVFHAKWTLKRRMVDATIFLPSYSSLGMFSSKETQISIRLSDN